jgi:NTE family protein
MIMKADAVFEGGGVKGIGLVGAICRFEEEGYRWQRLAGTSAGAIVAALLAAGYTGRELKKIIMELDYTQFQDRDKLQCIPLIGKFLGVMIEKGVYSGDKLEEWMEKMLKLKGRSKFKDVALNRESRLKIIATDITKRSILTLPDGLKESFIFPGNERLRMKDHFNTGFSLQGYDN